MKKLYLYLILIIFINIFSLPSYAVTGPTLLMDKNPNGSQYTVGIGPTITYKRVSGPYDFGGDANLWGVRAFAGRLRDPAIGLMYRAGTLNGTSLEFDMQMGGLTLEDSFREDARVKWRASFGVGEYNLKTSASGRDLNSGSFAFIEPVIVGVLPMSRHIVLEFSTGYTFAKTTGVKIEGLMLEAELLFGRF
jgi:hypothetical protein